MEDRTKMNRVNVVLQISLLQDRKPGDIYGDNHCKVVVTKETLSLLKFSPP